MAERLSGPRRAGLCAQFVAIVRATGNARAAARALGYPNLFDNRMKRDPKFRAEVAAAKAAAEAGRAEPRVRGL